MRIEAWACDRCGRLVPTGLGPDPDEPPLDWREVRVHVVGERDEFDRHLLVCSDQCASIALRTDGAAHRPAKAAAPLKRGGKFVCPECGRKFDRPQGLGAHRRSTHGVAGAGRQ